MTIIIKPNPITTEEEALVNDFCKSMLFDIVLSPTLISEERDRYNKLFDDQFYLLVDKIFSSKNDRESLFNQYVFNISPAADNKPFFSQFLKLENFNLLKKEFGDENIPFLELGYVLLYVTLIQILFVAIGLIILPLFKYGFSGKNKFGVLLYFGGIGFAYMFIEIIFIQMYTLYFGNPISSASTVICLMLVCSGIGSYATHKFKLVHNKSKLILAIILFLLLMRRMGLLNRLIRIVLMSTDSMKWQSVELRYSLSVILKRRCWNCRYQKLQSPTDISSTLWGIYLIPYPVLLLPAHPLFFP